MGSEKAQLQKSVGVFSGTALIVGTMIGSGLFISPKGVLEGTGSVGLSLLVWGLCGGLATLGALSYAELGTSIPQSGGEHAYLLYAFGKGKREKNIGRIVAFFFDWVGLIILRPTMFTVVSLSLGTYAVKPFFPGCEQVPDLPVKLVTILAMLTLAAVNVYSVRLATIIQNTMTVVKLLAVLIIVISGIVYLAKGNTEYLAEGFQDTTFGASLAIAFYNGLWAYDGWNNLNFVTEEMHNPSRNLPLCIIIGIPLTSLAYVLSNIGYFAVMSKEEVIASHAVAVTWGERVFGQSWIMPAFVAMSCFGSANGVLFSTGRLCFAAARDEHFPSILSFIQRDRLTPMPSIIFTAFVGICTVIPGDLSTLIDFYSFSLWLFYGATMVALLYLRYKEPDLVRPYKVPVVIPVTVLVMSLYLTITPIVQTGRITFLYAALFIASGTFVYFPFVYYTQQFKALNRIYRTLQILCDVVPTVSSSFID